MRRRPPTTGTTTMHCHNMNCEMFNEGTPVRYSLYHSGNDPDAWQDPEACPHCNSELFDDALDLDAMLDPLLTSMDNLGAPVPWQLNPEALMDVIITELRRQNQPTLKQEHATRPGSIYVDHDTGWI